MNEIERKRVGYIEREREQSELANVANLTLRVLDATTKSQFANVECKFNLVTSFIAYITDWPIDALL